MTLEEAIEAVEEDVKKTFAAMQWEQAAYLSSDPGMRLVYIERSADKLLTGNLCDDVKQHFNKRGVTR